MVFTSLPIYLDPPNWNQPNQQMNINSLSNNNSELIISPASMITHTNNQPSQNPNTSPNPRPGSMSEQARLAKIPQPEPALKCPRCDSTNTKFCYFNNYSLLQPRHFCKTCRRYWTRGGALRSVPVGGGCRRNKRSSKKLQGGGTNNNSTSANSSSCSSTTTSSGSTIIPSNFIAANHQLNFLSSLHPFGDLGMNFMSMPQPMDGGGDYQLGMQQYPFLGGINYPNFNGESSTSGGGGELGLGFHLPVKVLGGGGNISSGLITQMASVKMEDSIGNNSLSRQYLGMASGNDQYLGGGWVGDLSAFNSTSSGNML